MIDLITGVPGSGKTYYCVNKIYDLCTAKEKKYKHIFTNINGLDTVKCNKLANYPDFVQSFEFSNLKEQMDLEYSYHTKSKNITTSLKLKTEEDPFILLPADDYSVLNELQKAIYDKQKKDYDKQIVDEKLQSNYDDYVKSQGVYKQYEHSLIIIDECHLFFELKDDEVLIRFLSYHRHFDIDLILVTQNKNLLNKKYLSFLETMYVAYPSSKRLFSSVFRYKKYASYQEYHANIIGNVSFKLKQSVFELYSSGSNKLGKSLFRKMLIPIFIVLILSISAFLYLSNKFENKNQQPNKSTHTPHNDKNITKKISSPIIDVDISKNNYFLINCFQKSCFFKTVDYSFTKTTMYKIFDTFHCKIIFINSTDVNYLSYLTTCDDNLHSVLKLFNTNSERLQNEKKTSNSNYSPNLFSR